MLLTKHCLVRIRDLLLSRLFQRWAWWKKLLNVGNERSLYSMIWNFERWIIRSFLIGKPKTVLSHLSLLGHMDNSMLFLRYRNVTGSKRQEMMLFNWGTKILDIFFIKLIVILEMFNYPHMIDAAGNHVMGVEHVATFFTSGWIQTLNVVNSGDTRDGAYYLDWWG